MAWIQSGPAGRPTLLRYIETAMSAKRAVLLTLVFLSWAALPSPSQPASDNRDQRDQIELHLRMAQRCLGEHKPELAIPELEKVVALDRGNVAVRAIWIW
jgi:hypothetical protein